MMVTDHLFTCSSKLKLSGIKKKVPGKLMIIKLVIKREKIQANEPTTY